MSERAKTSSRSPSAPRRTIGAIWSGKMPGNSGSLPVRSLGRETNPGSPLW
jgi:hypothetical protein